MGHGSERCDKYGGHCHESVHHLPLSGDMLMTAEFSNRTFSWARG